MKMKLPLSAMMVLISVSGLAQDPPKGTVAEGGEPDDRASARILYWNRDANRSAGWLAIDYGRPAWKKDYEDPAKLDTLTKGKIWRMGSNYWTVLDTSLPLKIAGRDVGVGSYFLGLRRTPDGSRWSLAFINPSGVRRSRMDAFEINKAAVQFEAPMRVEKADSVVEKLIITLSHSKQDIKSVTMKVAWGNLALSTPIQVALAE